MSDSDLAGTATTDPDDKFVVYLPPGSYFLAQPERPGWRSYFDVVIPGKRPMRSSHVIVEGGKLTPINVFIDNGMR